MEGLPSSKPRAKPNTNLVKDKTTCEARTCEFSFPIDCQMYVFREIISTRILTEKQCMETLRDMEKDEDGY